MARKSPSDSDTGQTDASRGNASLTSLQHATLKDLRKSTRLTQDELAARLGVGQDTISRLEKRDDMLLSTLRHYVESVGGTLTVLAQLPNQAPLIIDQTGELRKPGKKRSRKPPASGSGAP